MTFDLTICHLKFINALIHDHLPSKVRQIILMPIPNITSHLLFLLNQKI